MRPLSKAILIALVFFTAAVLMRIWIGSLVERLPVNYTNEVILSEEDTFRDSPSGEWTANTLVTRRVDQTIANSGQVLIIEGALHVYHTTGEVNFETTNLYGVDRRTRLNVPGFGDVDRTGLYLFPPHVKKSQYFIWDPYFIGLREATFERIEQFGELEVYVFSFIGTGMDETAGYSYLAGVPERYLVQTDGQGIIWVEPLSGKVLDYKDCGVSYFVDSSNGVRVADFNIWDESFTPETNTAQLKLARAARLQILLIEVWLPSGFLFTGLIWLAIGFWKRKSNA
jgi:hypothetical protein